MRLGVLDIGSNTVHMLAADVRPGGRPLATTSDRTVLRLMRYLTPHGAISEEGVVALEAAVAQARRVAETERVDALLATATSAVRDARNGADVIARIEAALGQPLQVLDGETEAELTFLAVRRWVGWSAGQLLLLDIGGGSLEIAAGAEEMPDAAASVPLGAGRMTVQFLPNDPARRGRRREAAHPRRRNARHGPAAVRPRSPRPDHVVGSSKAIRSLARSGRLSGARMVGDRTDAAPPGLARLVDPSAGAATRVGPTGAPRHHPDRTFQIVAAAVSLHAAMTALKVEELEVSPWALREGVLLRYIEQLSWSDARS